MNERSFKIGVDAWWLDTTEPETEGRETNILVDQQDRRSEMVRDTPTCFR